MFIIFFSLVLSNRVHINFFFLFQNRLSVSFVFISHCWIYKTQNKIERITISGVTLTHSTGKCCRVSMHSHKKHSTIKRCILFFVLCRRHSTAEHHHHRIIGSTTIAISNTHKKIYYFFSPVLRSRSRSSFFLLLLSSLFSILYYSLYSATHTNIWNWSETIDAHLNETFALLHALNREIFDLILKLDFIKTKHYFVWKHQILQNQMKTTLARTVNNRADKKGRIKTNKELLGNRSKYIEQLTLRFWHSLCLSWTFYSLFSFCLCNLFGFGWLYSIQKGNRNRYKHLEIWIENRKNSPHKKAKKSKKICWWIPRKWFTENSHTGMICFLANNSHKTECVHHRIAYKKLRNRCTTREDVYTYRIQREREEPALCSKLNSCTWNHFSLLLSHFLFACLFVFVYVNGVNSELSTA